MWKAVQTFAYRIKSPAIEPFIEFNNILQGKDPQATEERWRFCVRDANRGLGWILSKFFVEKAFSKEAKQFGDTIVSDIKDEFISKLDSADWMSPEVRELGIEKVHNIVQKIGYPTKSPDVRNATAIREYYSPYPSTQTPSSITGCPSTNSPTARCGPRSGNRLTATNGA